jgi:hypothetical protein
MKSARCRSNKLRSNELELLFVASPTTVRRGARAGSVRTYLQPRWIRIPANPTRSKIRPRRLCIFRALNIHARYAKAKSSDSRNLQLITKAVICSSTHCTAIEKPHRRSESQVRGRVVADSEVERFLDTKRKSNYRFLHSAALRSE